VEHCRLAARPRIGPRDRRFRSEALGCEPPPCFASEAVTPCAKTRRGFGSRRRRRVGPGPKGDALTFRPQSSIHPVSLELHEPGESSCYRPMPRWASGVGSGTRRAARWCVRFPLCVKCSRSRRFEATRKRPGPGRHGRHERARKWREPERPPPNARQPNAAICASAACRLIAGIAISGWRS
jgi:hypothetical protein